MSVLRSFCWRTRTCLQQHDIFQRCLISNTVDSKCCNALDMAIVLALCIWIVLYKISTCFIIHKKQKENLCPFQIMSRSIPYFFPVLSSSLTQSFGFLQSLVSFSLILFPFLLDPTLLPFFSCLFHLSVNLLLSTLLLLFIFSHSVSQIPLSS